MDKTTKNTPKRIAFIDYKPAELRDNKSWYIEYYAKNPQTEKLDRFRNRVPKMKSVQERRKYAKKMILAINQKLESGWSPFYENPHNQYKSLKDGLELYLSRVSACARYR